MKSKYAVYLGEAERAWLRTLVGCGTAPARHLAHARILLKADQGDGGPGWTDAAIAGALEVCARTVARVRQWSLRLLAGELVRLEVVETISQETVRRPLKQTLSSRG